MFPSEKLFHLGPLRPEKHEKKKTQRKKEGVTNETSRNETEKTHL
jgi:hypothetical protein